MYECFSFYDTVWECFGWFNIEVICLKRFDFSGLGFACDHGQWLVKYVLDVHCCKISFLLVICVDKEMHVRIYGIMQFAGYNMVDN